MGSGITKSDFIACSCARVAIRNYGGGFRVSRLFQGLLYLRFYGRVLLASVVVLLVLGSFGLCHPYDPPDGGLSLC